MERIDKYISVALGVSRRDATDIVKKGIVLVNGKRVASVKEKVDEVNDEVVYRGERLSFNRYVYIMMNKPKGVISASEGSKDKTVVDILPNDMKRKNLFPAGRLDKDTTGFILITDDGDFAHRILSPKRHIPKTYIATLDKPFDDNLVAEFERGVMLKDDECMPAQIEAANSDRTAARVTIKQGMYHQIKRMFLKFGITVLELKRIKMGELELDNSLQEGECRYMTPEELKIVECCK